MSAEQKATQADALAFRRSGDPGELLLCLRMEQSAELAQSAHNILDDALNRFCPGVSRADLREEEADRMIMSNIKAQSTWPEGFANKLYLASRASHSAACGMGSNQRHRKRVTSLALAMLLICEHSQSPQCQIFFQTHPLLLSLARVCMNAYTAPQEATAAPAPLVVPVAPAQPAQPAPVVACPEPGPQTPAERLQHLARSLGADDEVLNDPYLFVQQETGHILCAACNKHLTAAHTQSKKHTGYLSNIDATLQWIRIERPDWLCLQILEMNGPFTRVPTRTAREAPKSGPPGPSREFRPSPRNPGDAVDLPMPTDEEIFDFLMALSGRKWCCWDARWFSTEDPQPTRFPGRPEINQPDPSGGQRTGRFVKFRAAPQPAEEEQEIEEV